MEEIKKVANHLFGTRQRALITLVITLIIFAITNKTETKNYIEDIREVSYELFKLVLTVVIMIAAIVLIYKKTISK